MLDTPVETRDRIVEAAEAHFRHYGYAKTTMSDIASACRMSPANLYRFFDSKAAIVSAIAEIYLSEMVAAARKIARSDISAAERLRAYVIAVHRMTVERYLREAKIHEICLMVVNERWPICAQHVEQMREVLAEILASGIESGEFAISDASAAATTIKNALIKFHHPGVITQCLEEPLEEQANAMVDFVLSAITADRQGAA